MLSYGHAVESDFTFEKIDVLRHDHCNALAALPAKGRD